MCRRWVPLSIMHPKIRYMISAMVRTPHGGKPWSLTEAEAFCGTWVSDRTLL